MATQHAIDEADIRQRIDKLVEAIRAMDLEGVKSIYAPDIVSFDITLCHVFIAGHTTSLFYRFVRSAI